MALRVPSKCVAFITLSVLLIAAGAFGQNSEASTDPVSAEALRFSAVYSALEQHYMEPMDPDHAVFDGGIRGMLSALDPFCAFLDRDQFELMKQQARGEALGFGSVLYVTPGKVVVLQAAQGSPSARAGVGPGDEIVEINGQRIARLDFQSLVDLLKRSRSQPVRLGVIHPGKVVAVDLDLKPAEVALPSVDKVFLWSDGIAYVHISGFEGKTPQEVAEGLDHLGGSRLKGLLLDLRDNHGGMVESAVGTASIFLKPDTLVLTTRGRSMPEKVYHSAQLSTNCDLPIVVLVNGSTASAAEVLAAALQEHDRALIAGEPTFGKGVIQAVTELSEQTGLALTAGQYFTPSGRSIQRPLPGTALTFASLDNAATPQAKVAAGTDPPADPRTFHTDDARPVTAGGGVTPDVPVPGLTLDPWLTFVTQRGYLTNFAEAYLSTHTRISDSFEPPPEMLGALKDALQRNGVRVPDEYWSEDQDYLRLRLKVELTNLVFGLAKGDEVETKGDPQAQQAAKLFPRIPAILKTK